MPYALIFICLIVLLPTTSAQEVINIYDVANTINELESEFKDKKTKTVKSKKQSPVPDEYAGLTEKEIEALEVKKERERRLNEQQIDKSSDDFLLQDPNLNERYEKGPYLVYDCLAGHWVCTAKAEFERCGQERQDALKDKLDNLVCADFQKFASADECIDQQVWQTHHNSNTPFCVGEKVKRYHFEY